MAFSYVVTSKENLGSVNLLYGTYTNTATDSGGAITTNMGNVIGFGTVPTGSVGEPIPKYSVSGGIVTVVTVNGSNGNWFAIGK